jgi:TrkA-C domain
VIAVATIFAVAVISLLITRVATVAFVLTGMSREAARFQSRSALTGTGFTTTESEGVVNHPVRRRIVMALMLFGGAGIVTTMATLVIGFANATRGEAFTRLAVLLGALAVLVAISRTRWFDRAVGPLLTRVLSRYTDLQAQDYADLLHLGGEWSVGEVAVQEGDWVAGGRLADLDLRSEGVAVLGVERPDGTYAGAPRFDTRVAAGDVLLLYGPRHQLHELDHRAAGPEGDAAHAKAVREHQPDEPTHIRTASM